MKIIPAMSKAEAITRRCIQRISVLLPFKDEVHILDAVREAMKISKRKSNQTKKQ